MSLTHTHSHTHTHTITHTHCHRGGRLVFSEDPDDNTSQVSVEPLEDMVAMGIEENRDRSWSNSSEKMGRFEVRVCVCL